jgi:hypothetical protein
MVQRMVVRQFTGRFPESTLMSYIEEEFYLNSNACDVLRSMVPIFGYNGFGEIVYRRSYSRTIWDDHGNILGQEDWADTVIRVINGVMSIRKDHYIRNRIQWNEGDWQHFAFNMAVSMFRMEWLPPGRGLWAMGTDLIRKRGAMALYNCAFTLIGASWVDDLCWLMDTLMFGVGVGFRPVRTELILQEPSGIIEHSVEDTREGWVDALRLLLESFQYGGRLPQFTFEQIRPFGAPIKTFGGTASGPEPLKQMLETVEDLCYRYANGELDEVQFKTDLANLCGVCVVAGNVRRSAEIGLCEADDPVFHGLKDYKKYPYRAAWGWMSNNSVLLSQDDDFQNLDMIAQANINGHDVGFLNLRNVRFGRLSKRGDNYPLDDALGLNPCQPAWAWVLTNRGLRQFKDIDVGTYIWSETGWTKIVRKISTGVNEVYRYHTTAGTFYGTEKHELVSEGLKCEARFCTDVDTLTGQTVRVHDYNKLAIMDGLVLGDGSYVGNTRIVLNIGEKDHDYFDVFNIGGQYNKSYQYLVETTIKSNELCHPSKRRVPERYLRASLGVIASFLRGLFSANGTVLEQRVCLKTTSIGLVEDIQLMLSALGIRSYYTTNKPTLIKHHNGHYESLQSYDINVSDSQRFYECIGFVQKYKQEKLENIKKEVPQPKVTYEITSVELVSVEETFDITVDNSTHTYWTGGLNVSNCGEIPLEHREVCNLAETLPTRCVDVDRWLQACNYATFYCSTVTLLPTHQPSTNAVVNKNRRIGVSLMDFTGWQDSIGTANVIAALRKGYNFIREENKRLADEAGIPASIRVTTVKPGGTVPKMAGRQSGAGYPTFRYTLRRINVGVGTPIDRLLIEAGVPYEDSVYTPNTHVFEYPIEQGPARPATQVTLWEQAMNLVLLQREWADNAVSNTLYFKPKWSKISTDGKVSNSLGFKFTFHLNGQNVCLTGKEADYQVREENGILNLYRFNPDHEEDQVADVLSHIAPLTKSVSLLPHSDVGIFKQMPEEGITKEEYERRLAALKPIDWSKFSNSDGEDEKFCVGDKCTIIN